MREGRWLELADGVYARRYQELDLTIGLVVGGDGCLVIDTGGDIEQGQELASAIREITDLPWTVTYTHAHFDHCFGTTPFLPCAVWAHEGCASALRTGGTDTRTHWAKWYREQGKPEIAEALERTTIELPDHVVSGELELDLGDRNVVLVHPGPAHTDHDLLIQVPNADVVFAGDVIEHAEHGFTAESFGSDTDLAGWPAALDVILASGFRIIVPGHGAPIGLEYVADQREKLGELAALHTAVHIGAMTESEAVTRSRYPQDVTRAALAVPYGGARVPPVAG